MPGAGRDANMHLANVLTTFPFCVQLTKLRLAFGVAVTVTGLPARECGHRTVGHRELSTVS